MTDNRTAELLPCPFCGGKAALRMCWMEDGHKYRAVECVECGATTPGNYSEVGDQSAWDWNTRTPEQSIAATLGGNREAELQAALNKATGNWAKSQERVRELERMLLIDDATVEDYTERADLLSALEREKDKADEFHAAWKKMRSDYEWLEGENAKWQAYCEELEQKLEAATLGSDAKPCYATDYTHDRCKYSVNRGWTEDTKFYIPALRHGTLTAEQVCECVQHVYYDGYNDGSVHRAHGIEETDWQAIADELNAKLESGTCHMNFIDEYETASGEEEYLCECSECGYRRWEHAHDLPLFCSKCGRKVN